MRMTPRSGREDRRFSSVIRDQNPVGSAGRPHPSVSTSLVAHFAHCLAMGPGLSRMRRIDAHKPQHELVSSIRYLLVQLGYGGVEPVD